MFIAKSLHFKLEETRFVVLKRGVLKNDRNQYKLEHPAVFGSWLPWKLKRSQDAPIFDPYNRKIN